MLSRGVVQPTGYREKLCLELSVEGKSEMEFICHVPSPRLFPLGQSLPQVEIIPAHFWVAPFGPLSESFGKPDPVPFGVMLYLSLELVGGIRDWICIWLASGGLQVSGDQDRVIS